jgi:alanyl-tRNA synthetase
MTKKLFHNDSYQKKFKAKVIAIEYRKGNTVLTLDQTCFYPNAGGQLCDRGNIEGFPVFNVQESNGQIYHYIEGEMPVKKEDIVTGEIDWCYRFDHMQQHSGQHLLSALLIDVWQKETLSFHMGEEICTLDIPYISLEEKEVEKIEEMANAIVYQNKPIYQYYAEDKNEIYLELRKKHEKLQEQLRIVEIAGIDCTACGGTHCNTTAEIAIIKIIGWENRKDKTRLSFICGYRAFSDYQNKHRITKRLSNSFTTGVNQLEEKVNQLSVEQKRLISKYRKIEKELISYQARELKNNYIQQVKGYYIINKLFDERSESFLRQLALLIINEQKCIVILGTKDPETVIIIACSRDFTINMGELIRQIMSEFNGKGGGSNFLAAGRLNKEEDLSKAFDRAVNLISEQL